MRGCHNCEHDGKAWGSWEDSPCAKCQDSPPANSLTNYDDISYAEEFAARPSVESDDSRRLPFAVADLVRTMVALNSKSPVTFQAVMARLENPSLSYAQIAVKFGCKKQNIDYHLKRAERAVPGIQEAFLVNPNYNRWRRHGQEQV